MQISELLQEHLNVFKNALNEVRDLKKEVRDLKKQLRVSKASQKILTKQNSTLLVSGKVLDGLDEDRLGQVMDQRACDREAVVTDVKVDPRPRPCTCQR